VRHVPKFLSVVAAVFVAALLVLAAGRSVLAQEVAVDDLPITPDPADCAIDPLTEEDLRDLYLDATPEAVDTAGLVEDFEQSQSVDDATVDAVTQGIVDLLACANGGDFLAVLAGSTEDAAINFFGPEEDVSAEELEAELAEFASAEPEALPEEFRITLNAVLDVRELSTGQLGALIVSTDPETVETPTLDIILFEEADGTYLLAGFLDDPYGLTPGYGPGEEGDDDEGTPAP